MRRTAFYLFVAFVATLPLANALAFGTVGSSNKLIGLAAGGAWLVMGMSPGATMRRPAGFHRVSIALLLWAIVSLIFWSEETTGVETTIPLLIAMIVIVWDLFRTPHEIDIAVQAFVVGTYLAAVNLLYNYGFGRDINFDTLGSRGIINAEVGVADRFAAAGTDPNELGIMLVAGIAFATYLQAKNAFDHAVLKWINISFIPIGLLSVGLTGSRTSIVALVPALIYMLSKVATIDARKRFGAVVLITIGVLSFQQFLPELTLTRILSTADSISSGSFGDREFIWQEGIELFAENPVVGVGAFSFSENAPSQQSAHSVPIGIAAELGMVGLVLFAAAVGLTLGAALRSWRRDDAIWLAQLAIWGAGALTLEWQYNKFTWLILGLIVSAGANLRSNRWQETADRTAARMRRQRERAYAATLRT